MCNSHFEKMGIKMRIKPIPPIWMEYGIQVFGDKWAYEILIFSNPHSDFVDPNSVLEFF